MARISGSTIKNILVIRWGSMGDMVIASAVIEDIYRAFPDADIHLNTGSPWDRLFEYDPRIGRIITLNTRGGNRLIRNMPLWVNTIRQANYDLIIDLHSNDRSRILLSLFSLVNRKKTVLAGIRGGYPYTVTPSPVSPDAHTLDFMRAPLAALGIHIDTDKPVLHHDTCHAQRIAALMERHRLETNAFIVIAPGSSDRGSNKRWGTANYTGLIKYLSASRQQRVVLIGGQDDKFICTEIHQACLEETVNLCGMTEVLDICLLAASAAHVIGNDTGAMHAAAVSGIPVTVLFGPTNPARSRPLGNNVRVLQNPAGLPALTIDEVARAII